MFCHCLSFGCVFSVFVWSFWHAAKAGLQENLKWQKMYKTIQEQVRFSPSSGWENEKWRKNDNKITKELPKNYKNSKKTAIFDDFRLCHKCRAKKKGELTLKWSKMTKRYKKNDQKITKTRGKLQVFDIFRLCRKRTVPKKREIAEKIQENDPKIRQNSRKPVIFNIFWLCLKCRVPKKEWTTNWQKNDKKMTTPNDKGMTNDKKTTKEHDKSQWQNMTLKNALTQNVLISNS